RIELGIFTHNEQGHFMELGRPFGKDVVQALVVQIPEADDVAELTDLHPVKNPAADIARSLEGILAIAQDGKRVLARFQVFHQKAVLVIPQQVAANGRRIQVGHVEVDKGVLDLVHGGLINAFGFSALEGLGDVTIGEMQAADGAIAGQLRPGGRLIDLLTDCAGFWRAELFALTSPREAPTWWAAFMTTSLTTITVTVAPETASTVMASLSLERPTTTR